MKKQREFKRTIRLRHPMLAPGLEVKFTDYGETDSVIFGLFEGEIWNGFPLFPFTLHRNGPRKFTLFSDLLPAHENGVRYPSAAKAIEACEAWIAGFVVGAVPLLVSDEWVIEEAAKRVAAQSKRKRLTETSTAGFAIGSNL